MENNITIEEEILENNIAYLKVSGSLDASTYEIVDEYFQKLFDENYFNIIVNLEETHNISSAGAGLFIQILGTIQDNNGNIILLNPSDMVKDVFEVLGLSEIFKFASTLEEAKEKVQEPYKEF